MNTILSSLQSSLDSLTKILGIDLSSPQVGTNLVYAKKSAETVMDVAGLSDRVVASTGGALLCDGVEPTTTIFGESPERLVEILEELTRVA